jgi:hypothetical protein
MYLQQAILKVFPEPCELSSVRNVCVHAILRDVILHSLWTRSMSRDYLMDYQFNQYIDHGKCLFDIRAFTKAQGAEVASCAANQPVTFVI